MPQVTFEHSTKLSVSEKAIDALFVFIDNGMYQTFGVPESHTKYRAIKLDKTAVIGKSGEFVHLTIALLKKPDRTQDKYDELGKEIIEYLNNNFDVNKDFISIEFREMDPTKYYNN